MCIRDRYKGVDFMVRGDGGEVYSPFVESVRAYKDGLTNGDYRLDGDDGSLNGEILKYVHREQLYREAGKKLQPILEKLNRGFTHGGADHVFSMADIISVLDGGKFSYPATKKKAGYDIHLTKSELALVKDFNIQLGLTGQAIPLKLRDKVVHRIGSVHDKKGLVKINHFDERVVHQRDNDGDHFYIYTQVPFSMEQSHARGQAFMEDFLLLDKDLPDVNLFGIKDGDSTAGRSGIVGMDGYVDPLNVATRNIGPQVTDKKAYGFSNLFGIKIGDVDLVDPMLGRTDDLTSDSGGILRRIGTMIQNAVDYHGGLNFLFKKGRRSEIYSRYAQKNKGEKLFFADGSRVDLSTKEALRFPEPEGGFNALTEQLKLDVHDTIFRALKEVNILSSDHYEGNLKSSPLPIHIQNAYNNFTQFLRNPNKYLVGQLSKKYSRDLDTGEQMFNELIRVFYKEGSKTLNDKSVKENFIKELMEGKLNQDFKPEMLITFMGGKKLNKTDISNILESIPQGKKLNHAVNKDIFSDADGLSLIHI